MFVDDGVRSAGSRLHGDARKAVEDHIAARMSLNALRAVFYRWSVRGSRERAGAMQGTRKEMQTSTTTRVA